MTTAIRAASVPRFLLSLALVLATAPTQTLAAEDDETGTSGPRRFSVVVLDVRPSGPITEEQISGLSSMLTSEVASHAGLQVISTADVRELLGFEAQRQLLSCDDAACLTEIGGALGASHLLSSELSRFGESWLFSLVLFDLLAAQPVDRLTIRTTTKDEILDQMASAVRRVSQSLMTDDGPRLHDLPAETAGNPAPTGTHGYRLKMLGGAGVSLLAGDSVTRGAESWPGPEVRVGLGYDITPTLGLMLTGMFAENEFHLDDWFSIGMVSLAANLTFLPHSWFRPYFRAGLGSAFVELDRAGTMSPIHEVTLGVVGMAGAELMISNRSGVFIQISGRLSPSVTESGMPNSATIGITLGMFTGVWGRTVALVDR